MFRPIKRARTGRSGRTYSTRVQSRRRAVADRRGLVQSTYFNPFPSMMRNRMKYVENVIITTVSDDAVPYYFSCNGIHDPNITGLGHQPYGHDIINKLYNHYRVDKSVITVTPSTTVDQTIWGVAITADTAVSVTDNVMQERKMGKYSVCPREDSFHPVYLTMTWKPDLSFPVGGGEQKNMNASYGSNPGEQMYFAVWARRPLANLSGVSVSFNVQIEYYVTSYELKQLDGS